MNKMYRYIDRLYSSGDEEIGYRSFVKVELEQFDVLKETSKGKWINYSWATNLDIKRFVLNDSNKRFACETKELALISFIKRKERQIRILETKLNHSKDALSQANWIRRKEDEQLVLPKIC